MLHPKTVYVVGAGFSAGLGYPLTSDLLFRLWKRLAGQDKQTLLQDLEDIVRFHHPSFDPKRFATFPNIEDLLSEMFVNEQLFHATRQYEGRFTRTKLQNVQRDLLLAIASWFHEIAARVTPDKPRQHWLARFREKVREEQAAIISFNWDLVLDQLLFSDDVTADTYGLLPKEATLPVLLKPHGSLNWYEEELGRFLREHKRVLIFGTSQEDNVYAFREFREPVSSTRIYSPLIVPPILLKNFEKPIFKMLWNTCTNVLSTAKKVIFLGYSMPASDLHVQFIMRCGFHNQKEGKLAKGAKRSKATGPADVVIVNPDRGAALRIAAVVGPQSKCSWVSTPVADWVLKP